MNSLDYQLPKGKVLVLRTCKPDMSTSYDFTWPKSGFVEAPDFEANTKCGEGLHGWLWGNGDYSLKYKEIGAKWLVVEVDKDKIIELDGKVKFKNGSVIYCGNYRAAYDLTMKWFWLTQVKFSKNSIAKESEECAWESKDNLSASATGYSGHASATGDSGHASATGDSGHASATGDSGHASATGYSGHASATGKYGHASATGYSGHASATGKYGHASATGKYGHASATGDSGHASATGDSGHASATGYSASACVLGIDGKAKCAQNGSLILTYWDGLRFRHIIGYEGENGIKKDVWYKLNDKKEFEELSGYTK